MNLEDMLRQFSGSDTVYRHWSQRLVYTEGVLFLAENSGSFWLIDAVASHQPTVVNEEFQLWTLDVDLTKHTAVLECRADSGLPALVRQEIEFTDFPLATIKLYVENGVLMLPNER
jgi:hypothetical protein